MPGKGKLTCCAVCGSCGILLAFVGIGTLVAFPLIFPIMMKSQLTLSADSDGRLSQVTYYWTRPPITNMFSFYFFNITNSDGISYFGQKPRVVEVGPYRYRETEHKRNLSFTGDGEKLWYQNYKTWTFDREASCATCEYHDLVTVPNAAMIAAVANMNDPKNNVSTTAKIIIQLGLLVMGEYPVKTVRMGDILFDGYDDPLLDVANSRLLKILANLFNHGNSILPFDIPPLEKMGYFVNYNNSADENYWINTGKNDADHIGQIYKWANLTHLPDNWWSTPTARQIKGSDGSLYPPYLTKSDQVYQFNSFLCRSLNLKYEKERIVHDIPALRFQAPSSVYDTTLPDNAGYRYANVERVNYYPDWPNCPNITAAPQQSCATATVDCSTPDNYCHYCCNGSNINDTFQLPPGMFPLKCFPGKVDNAPFSAMFSAPHFLYAPQPVIDSVDGLQPNPDLHTPVVWDIEPTSGTTLEAHFRLQVSIPMYRDNIACSLKHVPNVILPSFWMESHAVLHDDMYSTLYFSFTFLPKLVTGVGIGLIVVAAIITALSCFCIYRVRRQAKAKATL